MATYTFGSRWMRAVDSASGAAMGVIGVGLAAATVADPRECAAILPVCVLFLGASAHLLLRPTASGMDRPRELVGGGAGTQGSLGRTMRQGFCGPVREYRLGPDATSLPLGYG